ncbi:MAG: DUF166 domain-containing protein [Proteobacteria bacterium]|nr:hypothetical protein [Desulfobacula sp.]MBU4130671.1 DUF166 domain-containing protein [Pseudomonadota bacterium]
MQKIVVFQQNGSGKSKIEGINRFGDKRFNIQIIEINGPLPSLIEDTSAYLPETLDADLVLDYLKHQDLSDDLSLLCEKLKIPMISSGKKISCGKAICPRTCCALRAQEGLKDYGQLFGAPKIDLVLDEDKIREIKVLKGAPCGATWLAAEKIKDMPIKEALTRFGLEVQFFCTANPAAWDPITGKSSVHIAADIHSAELKACLKKKGCP